MKPLREEIYMAVSHLGIGNIVRKKVKRTELAVIKSSIFSPVIDKVYKQHQLVILIYIYKIYTWQ